jgi:biotin operon repressor
MKKKKLAQTNDEFDKRFDQGQDIHELVDLSRATIRKPGKKVRITLDVSQTLVEEIDQIRESIGVDRGALIKVWIHERVQHEKEKQTS